MIPNKRFLEQCQLVRYDLAAICAMLKARNYDRTDLESLLGRLLEDADATLAIGEIPDWDGLKSVMKGTLKILSEYLE